MKKTILVYLTLFISIALYAQPKIEWNKESHDFGNVKEDGGKVSFVFAFTNVGNQDLLIKDVVSPCGCTTPSWSKAIIAPGKSGYVEATYDPLLRPGVFNKVLTVKSNATPPNAYLTIMGEVSPRKRTIADNYPTLKGGLRFKLPQVYLGKIASNEVDSYHIRFYNESKSAITIEKVMAEPHMRFEIPKSTIAPKGFGKIIVYYDAAAKGDFGMVNDFIVISSDDALEPEKNMFVVADIEPFQPVLTADQMANAAQLTVEKEELDFGTLKSGNVVRGKFLVTNTGKSALRLLQIKPDCGCTSTNPEKTILQPGEFTNILLEFNTKDEDGLVVKYIDVYSSDPIKSKITLRVRAIITK